MFYIWMLLIAAVSMIWMPIAHISLKKQKLLEPFVALWAWAMISVSVVHILPEAISLNSGWEFFFIWWFILIYLIENFFMVHWCVEHTCHYHHISLVSWIAMLVHTLFDWLWIWVWFLNSSKLWTIILIWVAVHQIPVSVSISSLLKHSKFKKNTQILMILLFSIAAPIWMLISTYPANWIKDASSPLLAIAWWSLLYIWASDLLPTVHKNSKNRYATITSFLIWMILTTLVKYFE